MADYIKDSFVESNRFSKVLFQRAKDVIDFELNELQDDIRVKMYRSIMGVGGHGSPDNGCFIEATGAANQVNIKAGNFDIHGVQLVFPSDTVFSSLTTNPGPGSRTDIIYMSLTETEVPDPEQVTELGETTRRRQIVVAFGVAEGVAIPTDSATGIWEGGTKYVALAEITRAAGVAAITQANCADVRGRLPRAAQDMFTEKDQSTTAKRSKVIVQALDAETASNPQLGVRQEGGSLAFYVDREGNIVASGDLNFSGQVQNSIVPDTTNAHDLGSSGNRFRNLYISGDIFVGDSEFDMHTIKGDFQVQDNASQPALDVDGSTGSVGIGGAYESGQDLVVHGYSKFKDRIWMEDDVAVIRYLRETPIAVTAGGLWREVLDGGDWRMDENTAAGSDFSTRLQWMSTDRANSHMKFGTTIVPETDDSLDLGVSGAQWRDLYLDGTAYIDTLSLSTTAGEGVATDLVPTVDEGSNLGSSAYRWNSLYVGSGSIHMGDGVVNDVLLHFSSGNPQLVMDSTDWFQYNRTSNLFSWAIANVEYASLDASEFTVKGNILPWSDDTYDLGSPSQQFANIYAQNIAFSGDLTPEFDTTQDLGSGSLRWLEGHIRQLFQVEKIDGPNSTMAWGAGSIIPDVNNSWDIGSSAYAWKTGYFGTDVNIRRQDSSNAPFLTLARSRAGDTAVQTDDVLGYTFYSGKGTTAYKYGAYILGKAKENWSDAANGAELRLVTTAIGGAVQAAGLVVHDSQSVSIIKGLRIGAEDGTVPADRIVFDNGFYLEANWGAGNDNLINWDANDYMWYDRSADYLYMVVASDNTIRFGASEIRIYEDLVPDSTSYTIGTSSNRFNYGYFNYANVYTQMNLSGGKINWTPIAAPTGSDGLMYVESTTRRLRIYNSNTSRYEAASTKVCTSTDYNNRTSTGAYTSQQQTVKGGTFALYDSVRLHAHFDLSSYSSSGGNITVQLRWAGNVLAQVSFPNAYSGFQVWLDAVGTFYDVDTSAYLSVHGKGYWRDSDVTTTTAVLYRGGAYVNMTVDQIVDCYITVQGSGNYYLRDLTVYAG